MRCSATSNRFDLIASSNALEIRGSSPSWLMARAGKFAAIVSFLSQKSASLPRGKVKPSIISGHKIRMPSALRPIVNGRILRIWVDIG
jgi:hypothetical protein